MVTRLIVLVVVALLGAGAWNVGSRLSSDAVSMAVGLVFGTAALLPATVMVLATSERARRDNERDAAYQQEVRDLYLGTLPPGHTHTAQWVAVPQLPAVTGIALETPVRGYCTARPFALPGVTVDGEVVR